MKVITKEEFDRYNNGSRNPVINALLSLEVGQALEIDFDEWKQNYTPAPVLYNAAKKEGKGKKFTSHTEKELRKWMILRVS